MMSTTSVAPYVPYQAYKSKRHSRTVSSPPAESNGNGSTSPPYQTRHISSSSVDFVQRVNAEERVVTLRHDVAPLDDGAAPVRSRPLSVAVPAKSEAKSGSESTSPVSPGARSVVSSVVGVMLNDEPLVSPSENSSPTSTSARSVSGTYSASLTPAKETNGLSLSAPTSPPSSSKVLSEAGPSTLAVKPAFSPRKSSTFRHVPLRTASNASSAPKTSSPLRPAGTQSRTASNSASSPLATARQFDQQFDDRVPTPSQPFTLLPDSVPPELHLDSSHPSSLKPAAPSLHQRSASMTVSPPLQKFVPPQRTSSLPPPLHVPPKPASSSPSISGSSSRVGSPIPTSTPTAAAAFKTAYRPGFQPKGVYRPLTDEFLANRKRSRDAGRIELTRLERRFEKLVDLHFSSEDTSVKGKEKPTQAPALQRRASSFFEDLSDLRSKSATELWRGVLESRAAAANGGKGDIRAAEQRITPWQDDSEVTACPHCSASFHPLTNRKHHCRLCGRIMCSLPVKNPQRPVPCSLLFISDRKSGRIEEVKESVDYGVKPRARADPKGSKAKNEGIDEKILKGVRICRECKPVMLRQQYRQEAKRTPAMIRLYEALISLESEIEDSLPQFQELMLSLSNNTDEAPTKEATAARKHLLQCFADYDAIAKRIRKIPCPGGPGSSQDRVQGAILTRANIFLQKNMFPLQSLPKAKKRSSSGGAGTKGDAAGTDNVPAQVLDPDSELARALQPLLEQEALLESFVEEATVHRKFEDARTLRTNLAEIRAEIDRIVASADGALP